MCAQQRRRQLSVGDLLLSGGTGGRPFVEPMKSLARVQRQREAPAEQFRHVLKCTRAGTAALARERASRPLPSTFSSNPFVAYRPALCAVSVASRLAHIETDLSTTHSSALSLPHSFLPAALLPFRPLQSASAHLFRAGSCGLSGRAPLRKTPLCSSIPPASFCSAAIALSTLPSLGRVFNSERPGGTTQTPQETPCISKFHGSTP